jgi:RNA polymerase sigma-70 factor (ECF subfamily)
MQSGSELAAAYAEGQAAWPEVRLIQEDFAEHMRRNGVSARHLAERAADLYLASACAAGDRAALQAFEKRHIQTMDVHLARSGVPPEWLSEVHQRVRVKLLTGRQPGIARYRGEGPLQALVRVTAVRVAVDVASAAAAARNRPDDEILNVLVSMDAGPELDTARALYREKFRAAVEETLSSLSKREKTVLRLHFIDGLNIDGIGAIYRVHRATVARWLVAIRGRALADLRKRLPLHLGGTPSELRSLVKLLREDIDLSARRILSDERSRG